MKVLVIAAHPDDEVLGCGGTIARLTQEGHEVRIAILGQGIMARFANRNQEEARLVEALQNYSREAGRLLGAKEVITYKFPDNRFDTVPMLDVAKTVEDLIQRFEPEAIYTHQGGDLNIDHLVTHRAVLTATRPMIGQPVNELYGFEVLSSTEWAFGQFQPVFSPNFFIDIKQTLHTKIDAMRLYKSELREFPHPRSPEAITSLARYRGSSAGMEAAEAFVVIRKLTRVL
jgi:LmbE family N-acetylglucosaminyl deacetylase